MTKTFGTSFLELAEDVVQDAMIEAYQHWQQKGIPENPSAWLMRTAKNKVLNIIKRDKSKFEYANNQLYLLQGGGTTATTVDNLFNDEDISGLIMNILDSKENNLLI